METGIGVGRCVILFQNVGLWAETVCRDRLSRFLNVMPRFWTFTCRRGLSALSISVKAVTAELLRAKPSPFTGSLNGNKILVGWRGEIACVIVEKRGKNDWLYWGKEDKWMSYSGDTGAWWRWLCWDREAKSMLTPYVHIYGICVSPFPLVAFQLPSCHSLYLSFLWSFLFLTCLYFCSRVCQGKCLFTSRVTVNLDIWRLTWCGTVERL